MPKGRGISRRFDEFSTKCRKNGAGFVQIVARFSDDADDFVCELCARTRGRYSNIGGAAERNTDASADTNTAHDRDAVTQPDQHLNADRNRDANIYRNRNTNGNPYAHPNRDDHADSNAILREFRRRER